MELYDVMRTTFAARRFTGRPVDDATLRTLLEHARFASSGGNRQGWHVIAVRERATKRALGDLAIPASRRYAAQQAAGESPWNSVAPTTVSEQEIAATTPPPALIESVAQAPLVLVVCVDLRLVASTDQDLERVGIISGASVYPFAWNILLAARNEGLGGTLTTLAIAQEPAVKELLGIPEPVAVAALMPLGYPARTLSKLRRKPVEAFLHRERWDNARGAG